ncbi:MAG TPA: PAS domain-containing protein, partial [Candidatus Limnocylindrales bacterium]
MDPADPAPQTLDDLLPVGVLRFDASRRVVEANDRAHALLDTAPGRLVGRTVMEAFLDARIERFLASGGGTMEVRLGASGPRT